ncbi:hypothetical protein BU15DRAFT_78668 [Melanogaster broomeanus]|nr:hypothetical protein BU15DRAFT_78668 [Melanogaster broomeanus]
MSVKLCCYESEPTNEAPYQGLSRKLILAFDVGTTYSGVSYCILDPGETPKILGVSRYPAQEHVGGDNKIPSILYYDQQGAVRAVGAEALQQHVIEQAGDENWIKLEWWKLHLRPKHLLSSHIKDEDIPSLPEGKSAIQVLGDFMKYLCTCARRYIVETHLSGADMWTTVEDHIEFVLTHPNGWEGPQQQQIQGEASLHFCVTQVLASDSLSGTPIACPEDPEEVLDNSGPQGVVIIDAGGGTIDLSAYSMRLSPPTSFEEIAPAECRLQGSVFVTHRAHAFLKAKLANSRFGAPEIVQQMKDEFDRTTKLRFRNAEEPQYIKFGTVRDKDPEYDIRSGQLKLAGQGRFRVFSAIGGEHRRSFRAAAEGDDLANQGNHVNKAVADGGISFYIDHLVSSRAARFSYGVKCIANYQSHDPEHRARKLTAFRDLTGCLVVPNVFRSILMKGIRVSEEQEFRRPFCMLKESPSECSHVSTCIVAYRGKLTAPAWVDVEPHSFTKLCTVHADTSKVIKSLWPRRSKHSPTGNYYTIRCDVILLFGLTELKAQISWMENGVERRGPASVVYDD